MPISMLILLLVVAWGVRRATAPPLTIYIPISIPKLLKLRASNFITLIVNNTN